VSSALGPFHTGK